MMRPYLPLNALRSFEASARLRSFTRAGDELNVTQAAVSHQVKLLEQRLGVVLFKRLPRGLMITAEGEALLSVLGDAFDRMAEMLGRLEDGQIREVMMVGAVGTFAVGWLLPRLAEFQVLNPLIDLRLSTHNNRVDMAAEGLDFAIRFGDGAWYGLNAEPLFEAPLSPLCTPKIAATLSAPDDLMQCTLLRSYRESEWPSWFAAAGTPHPPPLVRSITFDSSLAMMEAATQGAGVALAPPRMFERQLAMGSIVQPFSITTSLGRYWLTRQMPRVPSAAMLTFRDWLQDAVRQAYGEVA